MLERAEKAAAPIYLEIATVNVTRRILSVSLKSLLEKFQPEFLGS